MKSGSRCVRFFIFVTLSLNLNLSLLIPPVFAQFFTITKFHSDITIHPDSSLTVQETIDVKFDRQRHGIYREIPYKYRDELGKSMMTDWSLRPLRGRNSCGQ